MNLNYKEIEEANNKRRVIQDHFLKSVRYCNHCYGTGLGNLTRYKNGEYGWDGFSYCEYCKGIGYLKWKETITEKLCPICEGTAIDPKSNKKCEGCNGEGIVDWVRYIRLGRKKRKEK